MTQTKTCTKCGITKPTSEFHKNPHTKDGMAYRCKECVKQYQRDNAAALAIYRAAYHQAHRAQSAATKARWRKAHREQYNAYMRAYMRRRKQATAKQ